MKKLWIASIWLIATAVPAANIGSQHEALQLLRESSDTTVYVEYVAGFPASVTMDVAANGPDPVSRALDFLQTYADLYLQNHPDVELVHVRTEGVLSDGQTVTFAQRFKGLPVFGAGITVDLGEAATGQPRILHTSGMLVVPARTNVYPAIQIEPDLIPAITGQMAEDAARTALGNPAAGILGETLLMVYDPVIDGAPPDPVLVYRVTVGVGGPTQVLIDANDGAEVFRHELTADSTGLDDFDLDLEDANGETMANTTCFNPTTIDDNIGNVNGIDGAYVNDVDAVQAWWSARATYLYFHNAFGLHSYDDDDSELEVYVHAGLTAGNASAGSWCGIQFGNGAPCNDVMGHEYAHMVIDETSDLNGSGQSGSLNESFSDILGQAMDNTDWFIGEDRVGGFPVLRDLSDPTTTFCSQSSPCPDRMSAFFITSDPHINANIINKAFYLMGVGGTHNGRTIAPMGRVLMRQLAWRIFRHLPSNASFNTARNSAVSWAEYFRGKGQMSFQNVCTVRNAFASVEIGWADQNCDGVPEQPGDFDGDSIFDDGDNSGTVGDNPCPHGVTSGCDDNCMSVPNPSQFDLDGNGVGDSCDPDVDGDGRPNGADDCPTIPSVGDVPGDCDFDGIKNCADPDDDNDGILDDGDGSGDIRDNPCGHLQTANCDDNCLCDANASQFDGNANGDGDACDPDIDGDGHYSDTDNCAFVWNEDQLDTDGDGYGDACDLCPDDHDGVSAYTTGVPELGIDPKPYQPDSDGDGIPDVCDPYAFGQFTVRTNGDRYGPPSSLDADGSPDVFDVEGPAGPGEIARLYFDPCADGNPDGLGPLERIGIEFTGLSDSISGWVEDVDGMPRARIKPSMLDPTKRGLRFRPRCGGNYRLVLRAEQGFDGAESFAAAASVVVTGEGNEWRNGDGGFTEPPEPLPDEDADGLIDPIDLCPTIADPSNADGDADGVGDVCDVCPGRYNPNQAPVEFPTVLAATKDELRWAPADDFAYIKGDMAMVSSLGFFESGTGTGDTLSTAADGASTYYLLRFDVCGTWGGADRDSMLP